jgi:hypothetical protein
MKKTVSIITGLLLASLPMAAQISIEGPGCIVPGVVYHYRIKGNWDSTSTMQVCLTGGYIRNADSTQVSCTAPGMPLDGVLVIWNGPGGLTITSTKGNATLTVTPTSPLHAGAIAESSQTQMISLNGMPAPISCAPDTGGACHPKYSCQWQQSVDQVNWTDVPGSTGAVMRFTTGLSQTLFYRRRVTETGSGTIDYSDVASVFVGIGDFPADSTSARTQTKQQ